MECDQNLSAIKVEPIEINEEIKSETKDELLVGITGQGFASAQEFKDAMEPVSGLGGIKTEPTEIKDEPSDEPFVEITAQEVIGGGQKIKEESDNDSQEPPKVPSKIQADNQSGFHAFNDNEGLVIKYKLEEGQSENKSVDLSTLYKSKKRKIIEKKDKPEIIKEPLSKVSPGEYTILECKRVQCNYCALSKDSLFKIQRHIRGMHRDKLYKCPFCPFTSKHTVSRHIISKHKGDEDLEYFECHTCGKRCKFKNHLVTHLKSHRTREELMHTNEIYKCEQCPKMFCYKDSLGKHTKYFHNNSKNELQCDHCAYRCRRRQHLMFHIQKKHTPLDQLKTLKCPECDFTTKFEANLRRHKYGRHGQIYQCDKCPFQTHSRRNLNHHEMTHKNLQEEDKKYKCKKCDYETYNKSSLRSHSSTHLREDKKYQCNKCDYRTYKSSYLKNHSLTHLKPEEIQYFYCYQCNFKFKRKDTLSAHIRRHCKREQKVEFACHICDFKTKKKQIYSLHIDEHNGKLK